MLFANLLSLVLLLVAPNDTLKTSKVTADRSLRALASSPIQTVSEAEIKRRGAAGLEEILRTFTGVSVKDYGGIGGMKTVSVRNLGAAHTAVCIDGIPIGNTQTGQIDLSNFNPDDLSSIRIEIAGTDDIFRSARLAASAGTLSLETRQPQFTNGNTEVSTQLRAGSFRTFIPSFRVAHRFSSKWSVSTNCRFTTSSGDYPFKLVNGSEITTERRQNSQILAGSGDIRVYGSISPTITFRSEAGLRISSRGLPGSVVLYNQDSFEHLNERNIHIRSRIESSPSERWRLAGSFSWEQTRDRWTSTDPIYSSPADDRYLQNELAIGGIALFSPEEGSPLSVSLAQDGVLSTLDTSIPESILPRRLTSATALSARWKGETISATAQLSAVFIHEMSGLKDDIDRSSTFQKLSDDRAHLSPSVSTSILLAKGLHLRLSARHGYRVPTFNDLYYSRVGNSSLKPERATQANLGLSWLAGNTMENSVSDPKWSAEASADFYWNHVKDKILAIPTMFIWKMKNAGTVRMLGSDLHISGILIPAKGYRIGLESGYSWQYAVDISDPEAKNYGHQIPYTPKHSGSAVLSAELPLLGFSYTLNAVGKRWFMAQNLPSNEMEAYADHSISIHKDFKLSKKEHHLLHLNAELLNMGNVNYEIVKYYPMPGINWRITIKYTY